MKKIYLFLLSIALSIGAFSQCTVTVTSLSPACHGICDGVAKATPAGSTGPYTYSWSTSPVQTTQTATGLCAGTYSVKVTNATGCNTTQMVTLTQPVQLALTIARADAKCNGGTAKATATVTGGTTPYTYSWSTTPTQTTRIASNLTPGTYTLTVTDKKGCITTQTVTIIQPAALVPVSSSTNTACGASTGTASVAVTGGTGAYSYSWATTPARTTASITGLPSGSYSVSVTDSNGCVASTVATVGNAGGLDGATTQTNVSCNGGANASATITASGGTPSYSYSWSTFPAQTTATISGLPAGTYYVSVKDGAGCTFISTVIITQPVVLATTTTHVNVACKGSATGTATADPTGGTPAYVYSWSTVPVQTTKTATGLVAGTYTVTVTDQHVCTAVKTVIITQPANAVSATITHTNDKCHGGTGATATAHPAGGTAPYTYSWSTVPAQVAAQATGLGAKTYHLVITDSKGCTFADSVVITQPVAINLSAVSVSAGCGLSNGSAQVNINSGGVSPFTYSWNTTPAQTTNPATGLAAGVYKATLTDSNGCKATVTANIGNAGAAAITVAGKNVVCRGGAAGSAIVTVGNGTGPYTYSWNTTPAQTRDTATNLRAGTYTVTVTEPNGCSSFATVTITQPATVLKGTVTPTNALCNGSTGSAKSLPVGGTPTYTYSWATVPAQTTQTATNLAAGTFTVYVTDANGCQIEDTVVIKQPAAISSYFIKTNVTCNGGNNGVADVTPLGGTAPYTYSWSTVPSQTTRTITGLVAGTYTVLITDSKGCTKTRVVTILQPAPIVLTATTVNANCGHSDGSATVSATGGKGAYTYSWNTTPVQTTAVASNLAAGIYKATVTDSLGCNQTLTTAVVNGTAATASVAVTKVTCNGSTNGAATVTVSGGTGPYTYSWNTTPAQTTASVSNLAAGVYSIKITDANGCVTNDTAAVTQPLALAATLTEANVTCTGTANGSASAITTGGTPAYTYSWSTTPAQTTSGATGLSAGSYTVKITDANGCISTGISTVSQNQITAVATGTSTLCHGGATGTATVHPVNATAPYTYSWTTAPAQTTSTAMNLIAGTYTVFVTDSAGCTTNTTAVVAQPATITGTTAQTNINCNGAATGTASISVTGGTSPYHYSWTSIPVQTTFAATNLVAGTYTVLVTDTNQCSFQQTYTLTQAPVITLVTSSVDAHCGQANGSASVSATGGTGAYTYSWNSTPPQTTATLSAVTAGGYSVMVTDASGCMMSASAVVNNNLAAVVTTTTVNATCSTSANGSATASVSGGTGTLTYSWSTTPVQTTTSITGIMAGTYTLLVTDAVGCTTTALAVVSAPAAITGTAVVTSAVCNGSATGTASVSASGGTPAYAYTWMTTPVQTTPTAIGLMAGTYTVTISDVANCTGTVVATVAQPAVLTSAPISTSASCYGTTDASSNANVSGGTAPYTYSWITSQAQNTQTATSLGAGTYSVMVSDSNGCTATGIATVVQPVNITLATSTTLASCGNSDGSATVTLTSGGIAPISYSWSSGATTALNTNESAGIYTVIVSDSAGCTKTDTAYISNSGVGTLTVNVLNGCVGINNASATAMLSGGTTPYTYSWSTVPSQSNATATGLMPGLYNVSVTDSFGCMVFGPVLIAPPIPLVVDSIHSTPISCTTCADASAKITVSGGNAPYSYSWSSVPPQGTQTAVNLHPGLYDVCVSDANGCTVCDTVTISAVLGIQVYQTGNSKISVYPNPSSGMLNVSVTVDAANTAPDVLIRLVNLVGEEVFVSKVTLNGTNTLQTFDLSSYPKGMYLLQMINGKDAVTKKLLLN